MGDKNRKKYLRRMAISSICAIVLCLACLTSATLALFAVEVTNEGNVFEVAQFNASSKAVLQQATFGTEDPVTIPNGEFCPEGSYALQVSWSGNTAGYIKIQIGFASEEKMNLPTADYVINLPAFDVEDTYELLIPLTLHEAAVITTESSWGVFEAAEGESTVVLSLDTVAKFVEDGGISFGTPFEASVTIGTDVIGEDAETAVAYAPGAYQLTIDWTPGFAGYCVLDFATAEEDSDTAAVTYIIRLPKVEEIEGGENIVITIPIYLHEMTRITAVTGKGTPDNSAEWQENAGISFGSQFIASANIGKEGTEYAAISQEAYEPGTYLLKLDWTNATADGYCEITVGDAVYYLSCPKDAETREQVIELELLKEAVITVITEKGALPEGIEPLSDSTKSITWGAQFGVTASVGVPAAETSYESLVDTAYEAGTYMLKIDWSGSNVAGYCLITVSNENSKAEYVLTCPVGDNSVKEIPLELKESAVVAVTYAAGEYSGEAQSAPAEGIIFEVTQTETGTDEEQPQVTVSDEEQTQQTETGEEQTQENDPVEENQPGEQTGTDQN